MPNRIIREAILDSEAYHALSIDARCLFYELLLNADDYGLVPIGDLYLKRHCPACEGKGAAAIAGLLEQIATQQMVVVYNSETGAKFACIVKFRNWPRGIKPKWPLPPEPLASKIKELYEKRSASASQTHSRRSASARETGTGTETGTERKKEKEQDAPVDPTTELWSIGIDLLTATGLGESMARKFLGSMLRTWPDQTVLDACRAAVGKVDPKAYIAAFLRDKSKRGEQLVDSYGKYEP
jgi:hypothetical protein